MLPWKNKMYFNSKTRMKALITSGIGSNSWAISGKHTESGKPLLASDPHLMKWLQSKWYLTRLTWGEDNFVAGGSSPGFPLFTYCRSKNLAYGATAINPDISDLFVEVIEGDNYFYEGAWHKLKKVREVIKVRMG
jgi:penicillin amidase